MDGVEIEFSFSLNKFFDNQVNTRILQPLDDLSDFFLDSFNIYEILNDFYFSILKNIIL